MDGQVFLEADVVAYICAYTEGLWERSRWHFFSWDLSCLLPGGFVLDTRMCFGVVQLERSFFGARILVDFPI